MTTELSTHGFAILKNAIRIDELEIIRQDLIVIGKTLSGKSYHSIDDYWNYFRRHDRVAGGAFYNAFKYLPSVHKLAVSSGIIRLLKGPGFLSIPSLIDINCRIDSKGEEKYLFGWHQDYWFSVCSTQALVAWIPLMDVDPGMGGLDIISNKHTNGKIFKTKPGHEYNSYADAVLLDDDIPVASSISISDQCKAGDLVLFRFNVLHRSKPLLSDLRSRFTIQLRYADCLDREFRMNNFKPGAVNSEKVDFLTMADHK